MSKFEYRKINDSLRIMSLILALVLFSALKSPVLSQTTATQQDQDGAQSSAATDEPGLNSAAESSVKKIEDDAASSRSAEFDEQKTFFSGEPPASIEDLRKLEEKFAEITELVKPATVNIQMGGSQGSGVVVTADGYILTAAHVIGRPNSKAKITFPDKTEYTATTLGIENGLDSGLLKIDEGQADEFPHVEMGISGELKPGQWVLAIGHPGGLDEKRGLVVRAGRVLKSEDKVVQTDCSLVGGDSGGPLVDLNGEVVAIHSRIGMNLWDNLHVPVDAYSSKWDLMAQGLVIDRAARLGCRVAKESLKVESVEKGEAAEKAGLKEGDVIKKIDDKKLESNADLKRVVRELKPYQRIKILVIRDDEELQLDMQVGPTR